MNLIMKLIKKVRQIFCNHKLFVFSPMPKYGGEVERDTACDFCGAVFPITVAFPYLPTGEEQYITRDNVKAGDALVRVWKTRCRLAKDTDTGPFYIAITDQKAGQSVRVTPVQPYVTRYE
jgi:hypothetical protein